MSAGTGGHEGYREIASCGDVILKIPTAGGIMKLRVSSHVLCTTSPVFRTMLSPNSRFKEASEFRTHSTENPYELSLEDDCPYALTAILLALHCKSEMVPVDPTFKNLVELAIVCDKYDCRGGVLSWVDSWTAAWKPRMLERGYEEWLFVAWVFGIKEGFDKLSRKIILESDIDPADGEIRYAGEVRLKKLTLPEGMLDFITVERASTIALIILEKDEIITKYTDAWRRGTLCRARLPSKECDALILGSIMQSLASSKAATGCQEMSALELRDEISRFRLKFLPEPLFLSYFVPEHQRSRPHSEICDPMPALLALIDGIISSVSGMDLETMKRVPVKGPKWGEVDTRELAADAPKAGRGKKKKGRRKGRGGAS